MGAVPIFNPQGSPAEVPGFLVGHADHGQHPTGCSLVLYPPGASAGWAVGGSAIGTRQTDALDPGHAVEEIHGVLFTGGSTFGQAAATGVQAWLEEKGIGLSLGPFTIPIVPTAVIFDLPITEAKGRPGPGLGREACEAASAGPMARGCVGAGRGATIGKLYGLERATKGGLGGASLQVGEVSLGALCVVNAFGDVLDEEGLIIAGARTGPGSRELMVTSSWFLEGNLKTAWQAAMHDNTTLALVTTNAKLNKQEATKVAQLAAHGLVRRIDPVHTTYDGDLVIVMASNQVEADVNGLGVMAARCVSAAVLDGVRSATPLAGLPAAGELTPLRPPNHLTRI